MWWMINMMKMSLQLFRSSAGRRPHTSFPSEAIELTETQRRGQPQCPIPPSAHGRGAEVPLLPGASAFWQGPGFSAGFGYWTLGTGKPHPWCSSLRHNLSRNTVQTRCHCALCSCWACKVSASPELPYLLCPTGCIPTRITKICVFVLPLHPLSG